MTCIRRAAVVATLAAVAWVGASSGGTAAASAATDPTRLWQEYPLEPASRHAAPVALRRGVPSAATEALSNRTEEAISDPDAVGRGLVILFALLILTVVALDALFAVIAYRSRRRLLP